MTRRPSLYLGGTIVALLVAAAIAGPLLVHADPLAIDLADVLARPSRRHWLGCDSLGRDMFARVMWGARLSLGVSTSVVILSLVTGSMIGGGAAILGGRVDSVVMRAVDIMLAFPGFLLAIALAAILGPGLLDLLIALKPIPGMEMRSVFWNLFEFLTGRNLRPEAHSVAMRVRHKGVKIDLVPACLMDGNPREHTLHNDSAAGIRTDNMSTWSRVRDGRRKFVR